MIHYRKATISDVDNLAKLRSIFIKEITECSEHERSEIELAAKRYFEVALAEDSFAAWLALEEDRIVATSGLSFSVVPPGLHSDGRCAYIMNMFTLSEYRRQGLGTELFKRIVEEAKTRGYKAIQLHATDMGKPLYEKYGFVDRHGEMVFKVR